MTTTNRLLDHIIKERNGHYCHALELDSAYAFECVIVLFITNATDNVNFVLTMVKILSLVLAAPLSIVAAIVIDYNLSFLKH